MARGGRLGAWLAERSGKPTKPPSMAMPIAPMGDAPGTYVLMK